MNTVSELMTPHPAVVQQDTPISHCAHTLVQRRIRHLPMVDGRQQLSGVITDFAVRSRGTFAGRRQQWMSFDDAQIAAEIAVPVEVIARPQAALLPVLRNMAASLQDLVVVVDNGCPQGIITEHDGVWLAHRLLPNALHAVHEGSWPVYAIDAAEPAMRALTLMRDRHIRHVPVMRGSKVAAVLSLRDLIIAGVAESQALSAWEAVAQRAVITLDPRASLNEAASIMVDQKIGCLPLVGSSGELDGIVTRTDIIEALVSVMEDEALFPS